RCAPLHKLEAQFSTLYAEHPEALYVARVCATMTTESVMDAATESAKKKKKEAAEKDEAAKKEVGAEKNEEAVEKNEEAGDTAKPAPDTKNELCFYKVEIKDLSHVDARKAFSAEFVADFESLVPAKSGWRMMIIE